MIHYSKLLGISVACMVLMSCTYAKYLKGGIYKDLDMDLTIVGLQQDPAKYLNKDIVFSVRYYKKGNLPCPLGDDYVNFIIMDRVSYITLDKVWMKTDKADVLDSLKEAETIVMRARVFRVDSKKDPNLEALEIVPE
ncbi:MAG: hypothetical protein RDU20_07605 [Desulfomonilaceae bacterium]|nr:hypothetical protein [Desulfomonilaceae bacterium]